MTSLLSARGPGRSKETLHVTRAEMKAHHQHRLWLAMHAGSDRSERIKRTGTEGEAGVRRPQTKAKRSKGQRFTPCLRL